MEFQIAVLSDRGVVAVTGPDAARLLQGIVTNDMDLLAHQSALHAGLLSPQGKILFDFLVVKAGEGFLLDVAADKAADLVKRLTMYKLRAKVEISDVSASREVAAVWHGACGLSVEAVYPDPRLAALGARAIALRGTLAGAANSRAQDYHAHRIALGVPEGGKDFAFGDAFPHEALFDQLNGVSFTKGCYVGQEVVSRMEHRGTARKRVVPIVAERELPPSGAEVRAGDTLVGTLGSVAGARGLALLRLDRAGELADQGHALVIGGSPVRIELPAFARFPLRPARVGDAS